MEIKDCINVTLKKNEVIIKIDVTADHKKVMACLLYTSDAADE